MYRLISFDTLVVVDDAQLPVSWTTKLHLSERTAIGLLQSLYSTSEERQYESRMDLA